MKTLFQTIPHLGFFAFGDDLTKDSFVAKPSKNRSYLFLREPDGTYSIHLTSDDEIEGIRLRGSKPQDIQSVSQRSFLGYLDPKEEIPHTLIIRDADQGSDVSRYGFSCRTQNLGDRIRAITHNHIQRDCQKCGIPMPKDPDGFAEEEYRLTLDGYAYDRSSKTPKWCEDKIVLNAKKAPFQKGLTHTKSKVGRPKKGDAKAI